MTTTDAVSALKESLGRLDAQRQSLEMEGEAIISELTSKPESGGEPMGIDTPLVDRDGYPRGDIDLYRARDLRHRLAVIKTDRKGLMKQIDLTLQQLSMAQNPKKSEEETKERQARAMPKPKPKYDAKTGKWVVMNWDGTVAGVEDGEKRSFENLEKTDDITASASASNAATATPMDTTSPTTPLLLPFAKIDGVSDGSPASEAGLKEGDLVTEFGTVNHDNHQNLKGLMPVVASAADAQRAIKIQVLRPVPFSLTKENVAVELVPKPWAGRGLIGCHIVPYSESA